MQYITLLLMYVKLLHRWTKGSILMCRGFRTVVLALMIAHQSFKSAANGGWVSATMTLASATELEINHWPAVAAIMNQLTPLQPILAPVWHLSLHLLLPQLIMAACMGHALVVLLQSSLMGAQATVLSLMIDLGALMMILSSTLTPYIALAFVLGGVAVLRLAQASATSASCAVACVAAVAAAMQTQAFFITGHRCEFAGLQYTAGFVGFEEFNLLRSGAFVAADTFGGMAVVTLALVPVAARLAKGKSGSAKGRKNGRQDIGEERVLSALLLLFGLARSAACLCATISAGVQRRHLYAWALFAPKFAFEVFFLAMTDILLVLMALCMRL